jgi:hypothetical protein
MGNIFTTLSLHVMVGNNHERQGTRLGFADVFQVQIRFARTGLPGKSGQDVAQLTQEIEELLSGLKSNHAPAHWGD